MNEQATSLIKTVPAAMALRKVPDFDPLKHLRKTTSARTGEKVLRLDLSYKKLWFRMVFPEGRMVLNPLRITDQMALFEAQLYADRNDPAILAQFTQQCSRSEAGSQYIQAAQDEALDQALDNAGFGVQLADLVESTGVSGRGSEILLSQVEAIMRQPDSDPPHEQPKPVRTTQTTPSKVVQIPVPQAVTKQEPEIPSIQVEKAPVAEPSQPVQTVPKEEAVNTAVEAAQSEVPVPTPEPADSVVKAETERVSTSAHISAPKETVQPKLPAAAPTETANVLQMLGSVPATQEVKQTVDPQQAKITADDDLPFFMEDSQTAEDSHQSAAEPVAAVEPETNVSAKVTYTEDMSVEEIKDCMTLDQAKALQVTFGPNDGWTLEQVLERRPSSLRFYALASPNANNVLKAASFLLLEEMSRAKAG